MSPILKANRSLDTCLEGAFGLEPREEILGTTNGAKPVLTRHNRKIPRGQLLGADELDPLACNSLPEPKSSAVTFEQRSGLIRPQEPELHLQVKAPQRRRVEPIKQVGSRDEYARERLHLRQHLVHQRHFPTLTDTLPVLQEAVHLINQQDGLSTFCRKEGGGQIPFAAAHPHREQIGGTPDL